MIVLAFDGLFRADFDSMRDSAAACTCGGEPPSAASQAPQGDCKLRVLTLACAWGGRTSDAEAAREGAVALVEAMSEDELAGGIDAPAYLSAAELYMDRYRRGDHACRASLGGRPRDRAKCFRRWSQPSRPRTSCAAGLWKPPS